MKTPSVEPGAFFALRTPLLPFAELAAWGEGRPDRATLRERLRALVARPEVREALFLASPSLDESLPVWLEKPESERGQKVERTLSRYLARLCGRPTPFGLFAGCSVGGRGRETRLALGGRDGYRRHTRLDGDYLALLTDALGGDPAVRAGLVYRPNSSLARVAGRLRYAESRVSGKSRTYHLVSVEPTDYLEATLERARGGARLDELASALADGEVTREEAGEFVAELVTSQLLVPELAPPSTGESQLGVLSRELGAGEATAGVARLLDETRAALAALDAEPLGAAPARYRELAGRLEALQVPVDLSRLFQVDMTKRADAQLGPQPLAEIVRVVSLLHRLAQPAGATGLSRFRDAFDARYQGRAVPLSEALDEESGIGFERSDSPAAESSPLIDGLSFGGAGGEELLAGPYFQLLFGKLEAAMKSGAQEIVLDEAELEKLASPSPPPLPDSLAALVTLAAPSDEALAHGEFTLHFQGLSGPSGANLLGRFCGNDEALLAHVRAHLAEEEARHPDAVFAEVVHLPEGRVGNVILRPLLRRYEIPYLGRSGAPRENQIAIDDLVVAVEGGRVVLRSQRLGKEVIPRLTTAHNYSGQRHLGVYRFLCALQNQGLGRPWFTWGALQAASFLPRVRVGRTVLALRQWRVSPDRLQPIATLRERLGLPRFVAVADGEHQLPVDFDNALSMDSFAQLVKDRPVVQLTELFAAEDACVRGPEGAFRHELVVPLLARPEATSRRAAREIRPPALATALPRRLAPGSEWLYAKLYTGAATADTLLSEVVSPLVERARAAGAGEWFFVRYGDPDWHLRLRFRGAPGSLAVVRRALEESAHEAMAQGRLWRLQLDTYEREVERYGGPEGMLLSEQLFCADSDAVLAIVGLLAGDEGADARWRLTLRGMDQLLDDLGLSDDEKLALISDCRASFAEELHARGLLDKQLGDRFRKERLALESLLDRDQDASSPLEPGLALFAERSERIRPIAQALRRQAEAGRLSLPELAGSFLHMHANRLLRGAARAHELVLYDFLERLYRARRARRRAA